MKGLRFRELVRIEGLSGHLEEKRTDSIDCGEVVWLNLQQFPKLRDRGFPFLPVFLRASTGSVLRSVGRREIKPRVDQCRIQVLRIAELLECFFILAVL